MADRGCPFGRVGDVSGPDSGDNVLAEKLLAVQRVLASLAVDSDARIRLNLRFMAICASLKMPGTDVGRILRRLDRLMTDAQLAAGGGSDEV